MSRGYTTSFLNLAGWVSLTIVLHGRLARALTIDSFLANMSFPYWSLPICLSFLAYMSFPYWSLPICLSFFAYMSFPYWSLPICLSVQLLFFIPVRISFYLYFRTYLPFSVCFSLSLYLSLPILMSFSRMVSPVSWGPAWWGTVSDWFPHSRKFFTDMYSEVGIQI